MTVGLMLLVEEGCAYTSVLRKFDFKQCKLPLCTLHPPVHTTVLLWAELKAPWRVRCDLKYQRQKVSLESFVALWLSILEGWRGCCNMSCNRADLHHLITQLQGWFVSKTMFKQVPTAPTTAAKPAAQVDPVKAKETQWSAHRDAVLRGLADMTAGGWVVVYIGSPVPTPLVLA